MRLLVILLFLSSALAQAEQKIILGDWEVHYIVFNTAFLTPEVAKANKIVRSKYQALVNISVLDRRSQSAQNVAISGIARNLLGINKPLQFKKVSEGKAIYYLAPLTFSHREQYRFDILIRRGNEQQRLKFKQELYVDGVE